MRCRNLHARSIVRLLWEKENLSPEVIYTHAGQRVQKQHIYEEICAKMDEQVWDYAEAVEDACCYEKP